MSVEDKKNHDNGQAIEAYEYQAPPQGQRDGGAINDASQTFNRGVLNTREDAPWWHSQFNLMLCVFALLGLATLMFLLLTPAPQDASQRTLISSSGDTSVGESTVEQLDKDEPAPFDEAAQKQARADSQDVLAELLTVKKTLEQQGVQDWAGEEFAAALALAEAGDALYQGKQFAQAIQRYRDAVEGLNGIDALIPQEISQRVAAGLLALQAGKAELAREKFESALQLDRNHIPALQGLERVKTLDQVLELLGVAAQHEQDFIERDQLADIEQALESYQQAVSVDPQSKTSQRGLERVQQSIKDKRYRMAMTEGFNALFARRFSQARNGFNQALEIKPGDATATSALRQSLASDKRTSLASLLRAGAKFEQQEQWGNALSNYQTVLQRDRNQVSAKVGKVRAQVRLDLDRAIKATLADTLAISKGADRKRAESILNDARGVTKKGPVLQRQIVALEAALKGADTIVKVALNSDSLTQVSLRKEGAKRISLGKFDVKNLALKPGRYTLTGSRLGFRDVRTEIELSPGTEGVMPFTISCTDMINEAGSS